MDPCDWMVHTGSVSPTRRSIQYDDLYTMTSDPHLGPLHGHPLGAGEGIAHLAGAGPGRVGALPLLCGRELSVGVVLHARHAALLQPACLAARHRAPRPRARLPAGGGRGPGQGGRGGGAGGHGGRGMYTHTHINARPFAAYLAILPSNITFHHHVQYSSTSQYHWQLVLFTEYLADIFSLGLFTVHLYIYYFILLFSSLLLYC